MNKRNLLVLLGFFALVVVIAIVAAADSDEDRGTRAGETYVGSPAENCSTCHSVQVNNWTETDHGEDHSNVYGSNKYNDSCAPCHVVGYDEGSGGFDSSQEYNSPHNEMFLKIQCENCHGPASAHMAAPMDKQSRIDSINLDRDPFTACAGFGTSGCHGGERQWGNEEIPGWNASAHSPEDNSGGGLNSACAECKSPSQFNPDEEIEYTLDEWRGITCGDCHDTHNVTPYPAQLKWDEEEICEECHKEGHQTMRNSEEDIEEEGVPSVNREDYPYMDEVSCVECHMWGTGHGTPEEYAVQGHSMEPSIEGCVDCHTSIYDEMPEEDYNTTNMAIWDAWGEDLQDEIDTWEEVVEASQARFNDLKAEVTELYHESVGEWSHGHVEVPGLMQVAEDNGTWTDELDAMATQAMIDFELADHASKGAHNPAYATALLNAAKENFTAIIEELHEGKIMGYVTDESDDPVEGAYITVNGHGTTTDSAGKYTVMMIPGTYSVSAFILGTEKSTETGLEIHSAEVVVHNFTLAPDNDNDGTGDATDLDDDNDGMPDVWELNNSLNPNSAADASADADNDGKTNLQEYTDGTDPQVADKAEETEEEADTTMYLILIIVLVIVIVLLGVMLAKKGGGAPALPPEEPKEEPPAEEEPMEEEEPAEEESEEEED